MDAVITKMILFFEQEVEFNKSVSKDAWPAKVYGALTANAPTSSAKKGLTSGWLKKIVQHAPKPLPKVSLVD